MKLTYTIINKQKRHSVASTIICGDTVLITNWKKNVKTAIIKDSDVADAFRDQYNVFESL